VGIELLGGVLAKRGFRGPPYWQGDHEGLGGS